VAAQGEAGLNELPAIVADDRDERLPIDARASVIVLAAQLEALQTPIGSIEKRISERDSRSCPATIPSRRRKPSVHNGWPRFCNPCPMRIPQPMGRDSHAAMP
jgi:hypothetical protein